jgi:hypothetical protein
MMSDALPLASAIREDIRGVHFANEVRKTSMTEYRVHVGM